MKEKLFFLVLFFVLMPVLIVAEVILLQKVRKVSASKERELELMPVLAQDLINHQESLGKQVFSYQGLSEEECLSLKVIGADARPVLIRRYLAAYHSPLLEFSDLIFDAAQRYGLDYRLLVAIAQQESNLCKKSPPDCFNCWGVGIHSRGTMCFDSYPEAIDWVAKYLREEYLDKNLKAPEEIMSKFCPLSNGSWASGVKQFMAEME